MHRSPSWQDMWGSAQVAALAQYAGKGVRISWRWVSWQKQVITSYGNSGDNCYRKTVANVEGGQWKGDKDALKGTSIEIVTTGSGPLYYFWQAEGISARGAYKEEDSYLKVRKRFYDRFGNPVSSTSFSQMS